jgi:ATP-dependent Clp protease ATP-binding subunit ClpA
MSMWEPFQERLRKSFVLAQERVQRTGGASIGSEAILAGIAEEGESPAAALLKEWGVTADRAAEAAPASSGPADAGRAGDLVFTDDAKRAIERCFEVARKAGHNYVGTEHMLAGMTLERSGGAYAVLETIVGTGKMHEFSKAAALAVENAPEGGRPAGQRPPSAGQGSVGIRSTREGEFETMLYTECLRAVSAALGAGASVEDLRANAKALFDAALADIDAARERRPER